MKKSVFLAKNVGFLLLIGVVFAFYGCGNFISGADFKEQLANDIAYANAKECTVHVKSDSVYGTFLSDGEKNCKVGYPVDLQFTVSDSYYFNGLKAVSSKNENESRDDCVEFTLLESESDVSKGVYKINLKVKKFANDIMVKPDCEPYPCITGFSPAGSEVLLSNIPIKIAFNMPVEIEKSASAVSETSASADSVFCYGKDNISIKFLGHDLSPYFEEPVLNETKTVLTIRPKPLELCEFIKLQNVAYIDLEISFGKNIKIPVGTHLFSLKENDFSVITINYLPKIEQIPPEKYDFFVTRKEMTLQTVDSVGEYEKMSLVSFSMMQDSQIIQNRSRGKFYIYGRYYDADTSVKRVEISESRTNDLKANPLYENETEPAVYYVGEGNGYEFEKDSSGYATFCIPYQIFGEEDGAYQIKTTVFDEVDNASEVQIFSVIKVSSIITNLNSNMVSLNVRNMPYNLSSDKISEFDESAYTTNLKNIKIYHQPIIYYGNVKLPSDYYSYRCEYTDKYGVLREVPFSAYDESTGYRNLTLDVDSVSNLDIKIKIADDFGNSYEYETAFPSEAVVASIEDKNSYKEIEFCCIGKEIASSFLEVYEKGGEKKCKIDNPIKMYASYEDVHVIPIGSNGLYGEMSEKTYSFDTTCTVLDEDIDVTGVIFSKGTNGNVDYTITLANDSWEKFDSINFELTCYRKQENGSASTFANGAFEHGKLSQTFSIYQKSAFNAEFTFKFYGMKGETRTSGTVFVTNCPASPELDSLSPYFKWEKVSGDFENILMTLTDEGAGPESCFFTINQKYAFSMDEETGFERYIPISYFDEGYNTIEYSATDKAGNSIVKTPSISVSFSGTYSTLKNENETYYLYSDEVFDDRQFGNYFLIQKIEESGDLTCLTSDTFYNGTKKPLTGENGGTIYRLTLPSSKVTIPENAFIRIVTRYSGNYSHPRIFYNGEASSGLYDVLIMNGSSKSSVALLSDAPVLIQTIKTDRADEECAEWSCDDWISLGTVVSRKIIDFTTDQRMRKYSIDTTNINDLENYVVVAHFADNSQLMSEIMKK